MITPVAWLPLLLARHRQTWGIVDKVLAGSTHIVALAIGASTLALILLLKRWPRAPGILIAK
jgi:hypothetical protein